MLLASALWSLREQAIVQLVPVQTTRLLFLKGQQVHVTQMERAPTCSGVEGGIAAALRGSQPESVKDLLRRWFGRDRANAHSHVIHAVVREAAAGGLIDSDEMGSLKVGFAKLEGLALGPKGQLDSAKAAALEPAFGAVQSRWEAFRRNEPELYHALLHDCGRAIKSRQTQGE
jgi:hypothetical protein